MTVDSEVMTITHGTDWIRRASKNELQVLEIHVREYTELIIKNGQFRETAT